MSENYFKQYKYKFKAEPFNTSVEYDMKLARVDNNRETHHPCQGVFELMDKCEGKMKLDENGNMIIEGEFTYPNAYSCKIDAGAVIRSVNQKYKRDSYDPWIGSEHITIDAGGDHYMYFLSFQKHGITESLWMKGLLNKVIVYPAMTHKLASVSPYNSIAEVPKVKIEYLSVSGYTPF